MTDRDHGTGDATLAELIAVNIVGELASIRGVLDGAADVLDGKFGPIDDDDFHERLAGTITELSARLDKIATGIREQLNNQHEEKP